MDRDSVIQYLASLSDDDFNQIAAEVIEARDSAAMGSIDEDIQAAQERGDTSASIALKQRKYSRGGGR